MSHIALDIYTWQNREKQFKLASLVCSLPGQTSGCMIRTILCYLCTWPLIPSYHTHKSKVYYSTVVSSSNYSGILIVCFCLVTLSSFVVVFFQFLGIQTCLVLWFGASQCNVDHKEVNNNAQLSVYPHSITHCIQSYCPSTNTCESVQW